MLRISMSSVFCGCVVLLFTGVSVCLAGPAAPESTQVEEAIQTFKPAWEPQGGQLRGRVIGIDPLSLPEAGDPVAAEMNLLAASYLYHYVMEADASPWLTRTQTFESNAAAAQPRREIDALVVLAYVKAAAGAELAVASGQQTSFSEAVQRSVEGCSVTTEPSALSRSLLTAGSDFPVCRVILPFRADEVATRAERRALALKHAESIYRGLEAFCVKQAATGGESSSVRTGETSYGVAPLARRVWPEGDLPADRVGWFCDLFLRLSVTNRSLVYYQLSVEASGDATKLSLTTNHPALESGLKAALASVGREDVSIQVRVLPEEGELDGKLFGVCRVERALTFSEPDRHAGRQSEIIFGEPVFLLDSKNGYYLLHGEDGYWGWVEAEAVAAVNEKTFAEYNGETWALATQDMVLNDTRVPAGARLSVADKGEQGRKIRMPAGGYAEIPQEGLVIQTSTGDRTDARVAAAFELLNTPYVFGGKACSGLDCSGLVEYAASRVGEHLARDAWQQVFAGRLVATRWYRGGIRAGDQVYYITRYGKVSHASLAISPTHVIESTPPGVRISGLVKGDRLYSRKLDHSFFMGKRP